MTQSILSGRRLKYDVIRITAILMVVMIHVSRYMVMYYEPDTSNSAFAIANVFNGIARAGTPMFLMLTGALVLGGDKVSDAKTFYKKRLLEIVGLTVFWLLFYAAWRGFVLPVISGGSPDPGHFVQYLLKLAGPFPHLWYMYMLIIIYGLVPLLKKVLKKENKAFVLGYIFFSEAVQLAITVAGIITGGTSFTIGNIFTVFKDLPVLIPFVMVGWFFTAFVPYVLIAWYIKVFPPKEITRYLLMAAGVIALIFIILSVHFLIGDNPNIRLYVVEMYNFPAFVYGVGLFTFISTICKEKETGSALVQRLSKSSFGVYILHVMVLDIMLLIMPYSAFGETHTILYMIILHVLVFGITYGFVLFLSKVKGLRRFLKA